MSNVPPIPWWALLLLGLAGGGAGGTALSRPIFATGVSTAEVREEVRAALAESKPLSAEDVRAIVKAEMAERDRYLLQEIRLAVSEARIDAPRTRRGTVGEVE